MLTASINEKRRYPRVVCAATLRAVPLSTSTSGANRELLCEDLSVGGLRVSAPVTLPVDARLLVDLDLENGTAPVRACAKVVWTAWDPALDQWQSGLQFMELAQPERRRLQRLVARALTAAEPDA